MLLEELFKGGTEGIFSGIKDLISTFHADPLEVMKIQQAITQAELQATTAMSQAQTRINEIEAANQNLFVSGWRPAIGWVCGSAYAYTFVLQPFLTFLFAATGYPILTPLPHLDMGELSMVLFGMLGLGAMRSYDKKK